MLLQGAPGRRDFDQACVAFGLLPDQVQGPAAVEDLEVWADNADAVRLFGVMATQWRCGAAGPVGLDYGVLPVMARHLGLHKRRLSEAFDGLRVMEDEALEWFDERRSEQVS